MAINMYINFKNEVFPIKKNFINFTSAPLGFKYLILEVYKLQNYIIILSNNVSFSALSRDKRK